MNSIEFFFVTAELISCEICPISKMNISLPILFQELRRILLIRVGGSIWLKWVNLWIKIIISCMLSFGHFLYTQLQKKSYSFLIDPRIVINLAMTNISINTKQMKLRMAVTKARRPSSVHSFPVNLHCTGSLSV